MNASKVEIVRVSNGFVLHVHFIEDDDVPGSYESVPVQHLSPSMMSPEISSYPLNVVGGPVDRPVRYGAKPVRIIFEVYESLEKVFARLSELFNA